MRRRFAACWGAEFERDGVPVCSVLYKRGVSGEQRFVPVRIVDENAAPLAVGPSAPAAVSASAAAAVPDSVNAASPSGAIEIEMSGARVRISGAVDTAILRQVLTQLGRMS